MTRDLYFGRDEYGYFIQPPNGDKNYVGEEMWYHFVRAGQSVGVDTTKNPFRMKVTEQVTLEKFDESGALLEQVEMPSSTSIIG